MNVPQNQFGPDLNPSHSARTCLNRSCVVVVVQDLLARRQWLAEQRRPRDEESLRHCTGRPIISAFAHSLRRSTDDLLAWSASLPSNPCSSQLSCGEQNICCISNCFWTATDCNILNCDEHKHPYAQVE